LAIGADSGRRLHRVKGTGQRESAAEGLDLVEIAAHGDPINGGATLTARHAVAQVAVRGRDAFGEGALSDVLDVAWPGAAQW